MSFRVAIVPEDAQNNGYILKPLVEGLLAECGKPRARVEVIRNPRLQGYEHAKQKLQDEILDRYRHVDLILFLPDADGRDRSAEFERLEHLAREQRARLLCCAAVPEAEIWLLAGHKSALQISWNELRARRDIKEAIFRPFLEVNGNADAAGQGREILMRETCRNMPALLTLCPELGVLRGRIQSLLEEHPHE